MYLVKSTDGSCDMLDTAFIVASILSNKRIQYTTIDEIPDDIKTWDEFKDYNTHIDEDGIEYIVKTGTVHIYYILPPDTQHDKVCTIKTISGYVMDIFEKIGLPLSILNNIGYHMSEFATIDFCKAAVGKNKKKKIVKYPFSIQSIYCSTLRDVATSGYNSGASVQNTSVIIVDKCNVLKDNGLGTTDISDINSYTVSDTISTYRSNKMTILDGVVDMRVGDFPHKHTILPHDIPYIPFGDIKDSIYPTPQHYESYITALDSNDSTDHILSMCKDRCFDICFICKVLLYGYIYVARGGNKYICICELCSHTSSILLDVYSLNKYTVHSTRYPRNINSVISSLDNDRLYNEYFKYCAIPGMLRDIQSIETKLGIFVIHRQHTESYDGRSVELLLYNTTLTKVVYI